MTRKEVLDRMKVAGYHNDKATLTRLYIENRVSFTVANETFQKGVQARKNGVKCNCIECQKTNNHEK